MHPRAFVAVVVLTVATAFAGCGGGLELVIDDIRGARTLHTERVIAGAAFVLSYVHSSEHVLVRGAFQIGGDGRFTVVETAFAGFGPGLPALRQGDVWKSEGGMIVHAPAPAPMDELIVRVAPTTRHTLALPSGETVDLSAAMAPGGAVRLKLRRAGP